MRRVMRDAAYYPGLSLAHTVRLQSCVLSCPRTPGAGFFSTTSSMLVVVDKGPSIQETGCGQLLFPFFKVLWSDGSRHSRSDPQEEQFK